MEVVARASYRKVPGFRPAEVAGHAGEVQIGRLAGEPVIVLAGRSHYYEGYPMRTVSFPIRVLARYGVRDLLLTNAAGAVHPRFQPGDFMALKDHINFMGVNPLRGLTPAGLPRFVDLSQVYDPALARLLKSAARACHLKMPSGVYLAVSGPSYETPAEIRVFRRWGADAVGMSTVPEAVVARQCSLRVAAFSCITNLAAGLGGAVSHHEVLETTSRRQEDVGRILFHFAGLYARQGKIRIEKETG